MDAKILAAVICQLGCRSRLKVRDAVDPESWAKWLIAPVEGYLEAQGCGPWAVREVEWIEVDLGSHSLTHVIAELAAAGIPAEVVGRLVRIRCDG